VYNPVDTKFLQIARAKGMAVITGIEMFVQQGARQFEIWTGKPAPAAEMQHVVVTELQSRASQMQKQAQAKAPAKKSKSAKK
jgi:3-dehydroquinate dehydratase/shikimate dehydrogenase